MKYHIATFLLLTACGGRLEPVEEQPQPISLCGAGAHGLIDPVKFCEEIPWTWTDSDGGTHPCTETCVTGSACVYVRPDVDMPQMYCSQP